MADPLEDSPAPCPLCGRPNCARYDHDGMRVLFAEWSDDPPPRAPRDVVVPHDLWERVPIPRTSRTRRRLVARAGQTVDVATARRLGIMPEGQPGKDQRKPSDEKPKPEVREPGAPRDKAERPSAPRDRVERK